MGLYRESYFQTLFSGLIYSCRSYRKPTLFLTHILLYNVTVPSAWLTLHSHPFASLIFAPLVISYPFRLLGCEYDTTGVGGGGEEKGSESSKLAELIHFQGYIQGSIWFSYKESLDSVEIGPVKGTGYWPKRVTLVVLAPDPKGRKG